jgi:hypothetical protein
VSSNLPVIPRRVSRRPQPHVKCTSIRIYFCFIFAYSKFERQPTSFFERQSTLSVDRFEINLPEGPLSLRTELCTRALRHAASSGALYETTDSGIPSVVFGIDDLGRHGNFHPASFERIRQNPQWTKRLDKVHTLSKRQRLRSNWRWRELDCANSSDALLMNIFCYPDLLSNPRTCLLLGAAPDSTPQFGVKPRVPLHQGKQDATEIDMQLGDLLVEAKLTESNFQHSSPRLIHRYRDLEEVFDTTSLPVADGKYTGYQLIRGTLAAHATGKSFCVLCDARRPDLSEGWFRILRAVRFADLRSRLKLLTWQELSSTLAPGLQIFLDSKYGIRPTLNPAQSAIE